MKHKKDLSNRPICPDCQSKEVRHRIKTNDYWCRRCGNIFPKEQKVESK